jgi:sugar/nucleoside kinase (ribokinase family)
MDQVDMAETGVVTQRLLEVVGRTANDRRGIPVIADSRRGLRGYPPVIFKMNAAELAVLSGRTKRLSLTQVKAAATQLAAHNQQAVFVTMAERGIVGVLPTGAVEHVTALPVRGPIDIVGAGDSVTANLAVALAAGASVREAVEIAIAASSQVIHQLGTTGTASIKQIAKLLLALNP